MILGAFTEQNHNPDENAEIPFGTQPVEGNQVFFEIEYTKPSPEIEWDTPDMVLTNVVHIFEDVIPKNNSYGKSLPCNIDVKCPLGNGWDKEIKSVALILGFDEKNDLAAHCTGTVLNNPDKKPYLLTAYHCIEPDNDDTTAAQLQRYNSSTWTFLFNHLRVSCNDSISLFYGDSFYGSNRLSPTGPGHNNAPPSDYLLLEIWSANESEFAKKGICYAGWNNSNTVIGPYIGIHHPYGDVKKISSFTGALQSTDYGGSTVDPNKNFWKVGSWTQGTTEGGSSGSALFDNNHRVVGSLTGGAAACNNQPDWYGKFSSSWSHGGFAHWLDPTYSNVTTMNSFCPTTSGGGSGGGTGGGGTRICTPDISYSGFLVNGNSADDLNVCINSPIVIAMPDVDPYDPTNTCYFPMVLSGKRRSLFSPGACSQLRNKDYYRYSETWRRCYIGYKQLFISIQEVNANNVPVGSEIMEWVYFDRKTNYYDPHNNSNNTDKLKSFDLKEFSPHNYAIQPNKRYRLKLANSRFNLYSNGVFYPHQGWYEKVKYIDVFATDAHLDNINVNQNLTANNISLKNLTVYSAAVVAAKQIEILSNTILNSNSSYFIDSLSICSSPPSYRRKNPNQNNNLSENNDVTEKINSVNDILLFPNPTKDNIFIEILNKDVVEGRYEILNYNGLLLKNKKFVGKTFQLNTKEFKSGIYFIRILSEQTTLTSKFIKQ